MTQARVTQVSAEVLRSQAAGQARVTQVVVEVLRQYVPTSLEIHPSGIASAEAVGTPAVSLAASQVSGVFLMF